MRYLAAILLVTNFGWADTITFRDGRVVNGSFLGGDARNVRLAIGDRVESYSVSEISNISFEGGAPAAPPRPSSSVITPPPPPPPRDRFEQRERERTANQEIAAGTVLTIRMIDSVDSQRDTVGQTFKASLDEPVNDPSGNTIIPRGADVVVKLVDDQQSGKIEGRTVLTLDIVSLNINGRVVDVDTSAITQQSGSRTARSAKVIGGTAALGAIIGAIAGGGKGAAIGAGAGAGAGTVAEVATKGQRVRVPSETRLTFTLAQPVRF